MRSRGRPATVTMEDVARRAGVSRALVSIVFRDVPGASPQTRARVMQAADDLAYRRDQRARLLATHRSRTIGVVYGLHREFHAELVEQLYRAVDTSGFELALGATAPSRGERAAVLSLLELRCEALLLVGPTLRRRDLDELASRVPVVVLARGLRGSPVDVVRTDDEAGAWLAVRHLADLGHTAVVHVDGVRAPGAAERRRGYRSAMHELGLDDQARFVPGGLTDEDGERAATVLWADGSPPTAVTAFNDHCAAGLLQTVRGRGVDVPGELSVVGYDDSHVAGLSSIALTTVAQDAAALADEAVRLAIGRAEDGESVPQEVVVPPRLVVRSTTAPPPQRSTSVVS